MRPFSATHHWLAIAMTGTFLATTACGDAETPDAATSTSNHHNPSSSKFGFPEESSFCASVQFDKSDYMARTGFNFGDSWMMSWAGDGRTITNFSDGHLSKDTPKLRYAIVEITDDPQALNAASFTPIGQGWKVGAEPCWASYIISTIFVDHTMYLGMVDFSARSGIARSDDFGKTLSFTCDRPMWTNPKAENSFVYPSFLQDGRGYSGNQDGYMYVFGSNGAWGTVDPDRWNSLRVARVPLKNDLLDVSQYTYFDGEAWSASLDDAADIIDPTVFLGGMQSIVYNPILQRYFLLSFGNTNAKKVRVDGELLDDAVVSIWDAPRPWGPWSRCGLIHHQAMVFSDDPLIGYIYNPSFNAKWIDDDGAMWISYANHRLQREDPEQHWQQHPEGFWQDHKYYSYHYGKLSIVTKPESNP